MKQNQLVLLWSVTSHICCSPGSNNRSLAEGLFVPGYVSGLSTEASGIHPRPGHNVCKFPRSGQLALQFPVPVITQIASDEAGEGRGFEESRPVPRTPLA
jgi:hypothetical protein